MGIELEVYDGADPGGPSIGTVTRAKGRRWQHDLSRAGSGGVVLHRSNPAKSLLVEGNLVRCILDGVARFAWVVAGADQETRAADPAAELRTVQGRGALSLMSRARLLPYGGVDRRSCGQRTFGWMAPERTVPTWVPAVEIKRQAASLPAQWTYTDEDGAIRQAPVGWYDPDAWWMWSQAQGPLGNPLLPPQPVGYSLFAGTFNLSEQTPIAFFITADDGYELWINDCLVGQETLAFMWAETRRHDVLLEAGTHYVRIKGTNIFREHVETNIAGVLFSAIKTSEGGATITGDVVLRSSAASFVTVGYPATEPGMTPGNIIAIGMAEAQARHASLLAGVTRDFDELVDSNGDPWAVELNLGWAAPDTSLEKVIETLVEQAIDIEMTPDLVLRAYNKGGLGSDKTGGMTPALYNGATTQGIKHKRQRVVVNAGLIRKQDTTLTDVLNGPSIAAHGRYEAYLSLATSPSDESAAYAGGQILDAYGDRAVNVEWVPLRRSAGTQAYEDVIVGDTVLVLDMDTDDPVDTRLMTITVADAGDNESGENPDGSVVIAMQGFQTADD